MLTKSNVNAAQKADQDLMAAAALQIQQARQQGALPPSLLDRRRQKASWRLISIGVAAEGRVAAHWLPGLRAGAPKLAHRRPAAAEAAAKLSVYLCIYLRSPVLCSVLCVLP